MKILKELYFNFKKKSITKRLRIINGLLVTFLTIFMPFYIFLLGARHEENNVRPYVNFDMSRDKDKVEVTLRNAGIGPAIIKKIVIKRDGKVLSSDNLYEAIKWDKDYSFDCNDGSKFFHQKAERKYVTDFNTGLVGDSMTPDDDPIVLLQFEPKEDEVQQIRTMRYALTTMKIVVKYSDIYENEFEAEEDFSAYKFQFN